MAKNELAKMLYKPVQKPKDVQVTVAFRKYCVHLNEMLVIGMSMFCFMIFITASTVLVMKVM